MRVGFIGLGTMGGSMALNRGRQGGDSRSYLLLQQERAGLDIKVPAEEIEVVLKRDG